MVSLYAHLYTANAKHTHYLCERVRADQFQFCPTLRDRFLF